MQNLSNSFRVVQIFSDFVSWGTGRIGKVISLCEHACVRQASDLFIRTVALNTRLEKMERHGLLERRSEQAHESPLMGTSLPRFDNTRMGAGLSFLISSQWD
ncbi:hypothetical protein A3843_14160 [Pseudovibrio exalbescens]|uniref:Uncharacterized protein n=1 Tax=Pseudovibrio exalbescens TaxID=197461 RepID=A0A1U7JF47_9HYPH|nr:hypothetical protein A3843_14160 [Pseudovibrio exalbescens]